MTGRPLVVICGSLDRAYAEMLALAWHLKAAGWRVICPMRHPDGHQPTPDEVAAIVDGHNRDIDDADLVIVSATDGVIGGRTGKEMDRAVKGGKLVRRVMSPAEHTALIADIRAGRLTPTQASEGASA